jgi:ribosomal protein L30E
MRQHFKVQLSGKNGIFRTENNLIIFADHVTTTRLEDELKAIRSEIKKMLKSGEVMIDLGSMMDYNTNYTNRLIVKTWDCECEVRPRTRVNDFSDITVYKFTSDAARMNYIMKFIKSFVYECFENDIPEEKSYYAQTL